MKKKWKSPMEGIHELRSKEIKDASRLSDAELKISMEQNGYHFSKTYQANENFIYRKIADSDVLISVGENIADFNGYVQLNESAAFLWNELQQPKTMDQLEQALQKKYDLSYEKTVEDVIDFLNQLYENNMLKSF